VDTYQSVPRTLLWKERVDQTAHVALKEFQALRKTKDFIQEGRDAFAKHIAAYEAAGGNLLETLCFVWYFATEESEK